MSCGGWQAGQKKVPRARTRMASDGAAATRDRVHPPCGE